MIERILGVSGSSLGFRLSNLVNLNECGELEKKGSLLLQNGSTGSLSAFVQLLRRWM